jgi:adenylate cyclase
MALSKENLKQNTKDTLDNKLTVEDVSNIPVIGDDYPMLNKNDGRQFHASILFIDLRGSTKLFNTYYKPTIAKIFKAYQKGITDIALDFNGEIRSFNGDSMLVFFEGNTKEAINKSVKCAMKISYYIKYILNPELEKKGYNQFRFWNWG